MYSDGAMWCFDYCKLVSSGVQAFRAIHSKATAVVRVRDAEGHEVFSNSFPLLVINYYFILLIINFIIIIIILGFKFN